MGESLFEEEFTVEVLSQMGNPLERLDFVVAIVEQTVYQTFDPFLACRSDVGIVDDSETIWSENQIQMRNGIAEGIKSHDASHRDFGDVVVRTFGNVIKDFLWAEIIDEPFRITQCCHDSA